MTLSTYKTCGTTHTAKDTADRLTKVWQTNEGQTGAGCFLENTMPPWQEK